MNLHKIIYTIVFIALSQLLTAQNYNHSFNKVSRIKTPVQNVGDINNLTVGNKSELINYTDKFGRTIQVVAKQASVNQRDIVKFYTYDNSGKVPIDYLKYVDKSNDGNYKSNVISEQNSFYLNEQGIAHTTKPYRKTVFEDSPLSRVVESGSEGWYWQPETGVGQGHTKKMTYKLNPASKILNLEVGSNGNLNLNSIKYQPANTLFYEELTDENENASAMLSDQYGKMVAKISFGEGSNPDLYTYYVYNIYDQLSYIVTPSLAADIDQYSHSNLSWADNLIKDFAYAYKYDDKNRIIEKLEPGADPIYYVYDNFDRIVFQQDGNLRDDDKWKFVKYDNLSRPIIMGVHPFASGTTRAQLQNTVNTFYQNNDLNFEYLDFNYTGNTHGYSNEAYPTLNTNSEVLTVNYYDNYDFDQNNDFKFDYVMGSIEPIDKPSGLPTAAKIKILDASAGYLYNVYFYDEKYRMVQAYEENILEGYDRYYFYLAFDGSLDWSSHKHMIYEGLGNEYTNSEVKIYNYDHAGRNTSMHYRTDKAEFQMYKNNYNVLGQLIEKNILEENTPLGLAALQSIDYRYNIRGWLKNINFGNLTNDNSIIDFEEIIAADERVAGLMVDTIVFKVIAYDSSLTTSNLTIEIEDIKSLVISKIDDPTDIRYDTLNEQETFKVYESLVEPGAFNRLLSIMNNTLVFNMDSLSFNEYDSRPIISAEVALAVSDNLRDMGLSDQVLIDAIAEQIENYFFNRMGLLFFNEDQDDLFGMDLLYNEGLNELDGANQYNGLISGMIWQSKQFDGIRGYGYGYDEHNRFTNANYGDYSNNNWDDNDNYSVSDISFDLNGNIQTLKRNGITGDDHGNPLYGSIDDLDYSYYRGANQLMTVDDNSGFNGSPHNDFFDNGSTQQIEYSYDGNGNLEKDLNKTATNITCNILNKPTEVVFSDGRKLTFLYDAAGRKLQDGVYDASNNLVKQKTFVSNYLYSDNQGAKELDFLLMDEGRMMPDATMGFVPEFFFRDHLGNVREIYKKGQTGNVEIVEEHHYYPFGMTMGGLDYFNSPQNSYLYQGKQLIDDYGLNWAYFHARMFDSQLGRWHCKDPLTLYASPYNGMGNNPVSMIDPDGRGPKWWEKIKEFFGIDIPEGSRKTENQLGLGKGGGSSSVWNAGGTGNNNNGNNQYGTPGLGVSSQETNMSEGGGAGPARGGRRYEWQITEEDQPYHHPTTEDNIGLDVQLAQSHNEKNVSNGGAGRAGLTLANAINSLPPLLPGPVPFINPIYGAAAVAIDGGSNLVGAEGDYGIILMLRGKDKGQFITYIEQAGGGGTGWSFGGELIRFDFAGGNDNLRLSQLEGFRHKIYIGYNFYKVFGVGISGSWSEPVNGYRIFGTIFTFGIGFSPFSIDAGYNQGDVEFIK